MVEEKQSEIHLADQNDYLGSGIHIGTRTQSPGMKRFVYGVREDGLFRLDIKTIDSRIMLAAKMIAKYNPKEIVVTASRLYAITPAERFSEIIGADFRKGRVNPGVFTNPKREDFTEPKLLIVSDSRNEKQAIKEASKINIPIIAISDTDNPTKFVDFIIPSNNRGRKSLAFIFYLLARAVLVYRGDIKSDAEFSYGVDSFEAKMDDGRSAMPAPRRGETQAQRPADHPSAQKRAEAPAPQEEGAKKAEAAPAAEE